MDSILAPNSDGTYQIVFGKDHQGLFLQRLEPGRFVFRHSASGLCLFYFLGDAREAAALQTGLAQAYDFLRDSTWIMKGQSELHALLRRRGLQRRWVQRTWHYLHAEA